MNCPLNRYHCLTMITTAERIRDSAARDHLRILPPTAARLPRRRILPASSPITLADGRPRIQSGAPRENWVYFNPRVTAGYSLLIDMRMSGERVSHRVSRPGPSTPDRPSRLVTG